MLTSSVCHQLRSLHEGPCYKKSTQTAYTSGPTASGVSEWVILLFESNLWIELRSHQKGVCQPADIPRHIASSLSLCLNGAGDVVITLAHALIAANLGVLTLLLLHEGLQLSVVAFRDGLRLHFDGEVAAGALDTFSDALDGTL